MKSIAALLLTFALALFPLSGSRAVQAVAAQGHAVVHALETAKGGGHHDHGAGEHQHASGALASVSAGHHHAAVDDPGQQDASKPPCAGDHSSSSCCSVSCHAIAPLAVTGVPAQRHAAMLVGLVALPIPRGVGFDGFLRPPRQA
jgi:hypothetical protein